MDKLYNYIKNTCVNFKLDSCCCIAPIRMGLTIIGYLNILVSLLSLVATAEGDYQPPLMTVQAAILDDDASKPIGIVAYALEMACNTILLSGIYRNDIVLLRVYIYFVFVSIISSVLVYSIVFVGITALVKTLIIWNLGFQCYVIILVRSMIVEIKETRNSEKNGHVTLYSVIRTPDEVSAKCDEHPVPAVIVVEPETSNKEEHQKDDSPHPEQKDELPSKLETVNEEVVLPSDHNVEPSEAQHNLETRETKH